MASVLFKLLIDDLDKGIECTQSTFADAMKLGRVSDTPESCAAIKQDLDRLNCWAERNPVRFNQRGLVQGPASGEE